MSISDREKQIIDLTVETIMEEIMNNPKESSNIYEWTRA